MVDGEADPVEQLHSALVAARTIAASGSNNVLTYLIEAALKELAEHGFAPVEVAAQDSQRIN